MANSLLQKIIDWFKSTPDEPPTLVGEVSLPTPAQTIDRESEPVSGKPRPPAMQAVVKTVLQPRLEKVQCITPAGLHRIAYKEWGDPDNPKVLMCVHGLTRISGDWDDVARAMAGDYRVICPDVAGRGRSDWLRDPMLYQVPMYVSDMVTVLARANATTVHWFGTSMGGLIGMGLASLPENPIERLILNDVGPVISGVAIARIGEYLGKPIRFPSIEAADAYIRKISAPFGPHTDAQWRHLTEVVMKKDGDAWITHYDPAMAIPFKAAAAANPAGVDTAIWHVYDAIKCSTLAVRGEFSDLLTVATHEEMAQRGPKAELVTIKGVGHAPTFMQTEQIAMAKEFLLRKP